MDDGDVPPLEQLSSMDELERVEAVLQSREQRRKKKLQIKRIGGQEVRLCVRLALDGLMTRELQLKFSKDGMKGKRASIEANHYKCLSGALIQKFNQKDINWHIGDLLKRAGRKKANAANAAAEPLEPLPEDAESD